MRADSSSCTPLHCRRSIACLGSSRSLPESQATHTGRPTTDCSPGRTKPDAACPQLRIRRRRGDQHQAESQPGLRHRQESRDRREDRTGRRRDRAGETAGRPHHHRSDIDPAATRAILHINRRCLQLTLRLLAANAEHYLARHLNAYLQDDDEYRAITRETIIRGLAGTITYAPKNITVTLDRPGQPRVARTLALLLAEINTSPPALPGDGRPITYTLRQSQ